AVGRMIVIDGNSLSMAVVARVARDDAAIALSPEARARVAASRQVIDRALENGAVIYGVTTGFGKLSEIRIGPDELQQLQINLLRSHASGVGELLEQREVRAALLLRANTLAKGFSGVRPVVIETLIKMLNGRVHPVVPSRGSVGASGDLAPSAHMALVLIGGGEAIYQDERLPGAEGNRRGGMALLELQAKEGLALLNGTQFMAAVGGLAVNRALTLIETADVAGSLSLEVLLGTPA